LQRRRVVATLAPQFVKIWLTGRWVVDLSHTSQLRMSLINE
jgi:hypothetical protein